MTWVARVALLTLLAAQAGALVAARTRMSSSPLGFARALAAKPRLAAQRAHIRLGDDEQGATLADGGGGGGGGIPAWLPSFVVPALGGALFGYDIGAVSAVARILGSPDVATASFGAPLSEFALGNVASLPLFGGMVASLAIVLIGDAKIGRLAELKIASVAYFLGTAASVLAPTLPLLFAGRAMTGLGIGIALHAAPLYIAETAPPELRGRLVAYKEAAIVFGIVLGYAAGALTGDAGLWRETFAPAFFLEAAMLAQALALPESPRWLALRGRNDEAASAVAQLRGCSAEEAAAEVGALAPAPAAKADDPPESLLAVFPKLVSEQAYRDALVIGCGLVLFQQLSGQPSVLYYANRLLESIGLRASQRQRGCPRHSTAARQGSSAEPRHSSAPARARDQLCHAQPVAPSLWPASPWCAALRLPPRLLLAAPPPPRRPPLWVHCRAGLGYIAAVGVGGFKLVMTVVSANLVESPQWGRRPLLLAGTGAMTVSLIGLAALYAASGPALAAGGAGALGAQAGVIALLFLYVGGYQVGFGPITWLVLSEIFPLAVRSPAMSVGTLLNFGSNYLVGTLFELERVSVGEPALFGTFAVVAAVAVAFIFAKVPETRGLSLEQIEAQLRGDKPP